MEDIRWPGLLRKVAGWEMEVRYASDLYFLLIYRSSRLGNEYPCYSVWDAKDSVFLSALQFG